MNEHDATATAPPDDPKADAHPHAHEAPHVAHHPVPVPEAAHEPAPTGSDEGIVPEAAAGVEQVTEPDPEHAPEPAPAPPPELAEVAMTSGEIAPADGASVAPEEPKAEVAGS